MEILNSDINCNTDFLGVASGTKFTFDWGPINRNMIKKYAIAAETNHIIHTSDFVAKLVGLKGVIAHGLMSSSIITTFLNKILPKKSILEIETEMRTIIRPGDSCKIIIEIEKTTNEAIKINIKQYTTTPIYTIRDGKKIKKFEAYTRKYISVKDWKNGLVKSIENKEGIHYYRDTLSVTGFATLIN